MKHFKLFFALFAMLALGVTNAWAAEIEMSTFTATAADMDSYISYSTVTGGGTSNPAVNSGVIRLYQNSSGNAGGNITITAKNGATITEVTIGSSMDTSIRWEVNGAVDASNTSLSANRKVTKSDLSVSEIKCHCYGTSSSTRLYVNYLKVVYTTSGGETPEPDPDPTPDPGTGGEETWTLVTNASNLKVGDQVVIAAKDYNVAISTTQNSNNRGQATVTKSGDNITFGADVQVLTLEAGTKSSTFGLNTGSGYLYASSSSGNQLKTQTTNNDNGSWSISISSGTATIKANGTNSRNVMQYNQSSSLFACYSSASQKALSIYKKVTSSGETPETPTPSVSVAPESHTFATTNVGETATQEFTITAENTTATLSASIDNTTDFAISAITGDKVTVTYQPQSAGDHTATMTVKAGEEASTTVALTGKAKTPLAPIAGGVIDILNQAWTDVSGTNYKDVAEKTAENTGHSNAKYVAQCAGDKSSIQLRSNNSNSGVVSTISGGVVKRIEVEWHADTDAARTLQIYGSNTAYTAATDLYGAAAGELLGELNKGEGETTLDFSEWTGDYKYIGFRSKSGAMYLTTVTITWLPTISKVTIADPIENGSISVSGAADLNSVAAGTVLTLSNTPETNYKLAAYDVYKTDDATTKVTVADGKFTMPEYDVTISATFELAKTLTSIEISTPATQTIFWQGEELNYDGLKVTAHFDGAEDEDVTSKITVTGSTATAGTQTVTVSFTEGSVTKTTTYEITVKATANTEATAYDVATAREIIDKVSTANDIYVAGIVSEIVTAYNATYGNITYNISADGLTTSAQLQAFRGKSFNGDNFTSANDVKVGDEVVVFGNLLKYNSTYELAADNKLISLNRNKAAAGLAFETTEYTANVNEAFAAPTLTNPNGLTVTYSTSDATLATVDATTGAVTILDKTGKVTITATFAGDESYLYGTASYNITISDPSLTEATFDATVDKGNATQGEGSIAKSPITFACTDGILGNGSEYRLYKDAAISFTAETGYAITKVVLTSTASGTSKYGPGHLTAEEGTYSYSDETGTWVGEAQTVTLTATAQSRATLITVYYKTDSRQDAGLAWSTENVSITLSDAFTAPTLSNPNGLTITCTSDNEDLATVTNAGVITLKSGVTGKATITAKFDGNTNYKDAKVTCTITVNPKTETVVILAQYNGQWYALKNVEQTAGKVLAALPVNYVGGKLYNVDKDDKATIEWQRAAVTDGIIFKNGENYISGTAGSTDLKLSDEECAWTLDGTTYKLGNRTFFYNESANGFKNYNISNAGNSGYSSLPIVTAPVYGTGNAYGRSVNLGEDDYRYGTICLPFGSTNFTGAEFFECVGKEEGKVYIASVTTLVAGTPYIFLASATEVAVYGDGTTAATAGNSNGLYGTFTDGTVVAANDDNHILLNNELRKVAETCWVNANRAYLVMSEVPTEYTKMPGRRYIGMSTQGENEATGFDNIQLPNANSQKLIINGQLIIIRDGEMYNAQGQKL